MIELGDSIEGEYVESNDLYFKRIGEPVPIKPCDSVFDLETLPAQPLAISDRFHVVCVAHKTGFCVARTTDVVASAKEIKDKGNGSSILDLSIVDVPVGKVHILAFSSDNSMLAASVSGDTHFFSTSLLINKEREPSFSCTLNDGSSVKDLKWTPKSENSYLVLSNDQKLYHGTLDAPLKDLMDDVDAVEWSTKGNCIAVARNTIISILSSRFKERFSMSLLNESQTGGSNTSCTIKVDSMKWVRADCIILGCFEVTEAGAEENYLIQIIRSKDGKLTDASSERVVLSFRDVFLGFADDIVPIRTGPYLFLTYVEKCELAIMANRKNTDQHIVLLGWSLGAEKGEASVIEIERDTLLPRIELQENGDDNLILGLCTDKVSIYEKIEVQLGAGELTELSPFCILMCLTLEGKLNIFHVASVKEYVASPEIMSTLPDEEECIQEQPIQSSERGKQELAENRVYNKLLESDDLTIRKTIDLKPSDTDESTIFLSGAEKMSNKEIQTKFLSVDSLAQPLKISFPEKSIQSSNDSSKSVQKFLVFRSNSLSTEGEMLADDSNRPRPENRQNNVQEIGGITNMGTNGFESSSEWYGGAFAFSKEGKSRSSPSSSNLAQSSMFENPNHNFSPNKVAELFPGKTSFSNNATSSTVIPSGVPYLGKGSLTSAALSIQTQGIPTSSGITKIESLPTVHGAQIQQMNFPLEKCEQTHMPHPLKIKQMTKELDMLLESIEKPGGFVDACTVFQRNSVEALEKGVDALSIKCQMWSCTVDQRLQEIQNLLDSTLQVLAKKIYMEGIVRQASDKQYWELWDRQKLSCELEMKQQHIVKMDKDMINQLIELEKHFNGLELNTFGENSGARDERSFQSKSGFSSHARSLHALHNTMKSQLAAAEFLSESLSKQMAALSIKAPSADKRSVKKELFETIGIPYDASFSSPDLKRVSHITPNNRLSLLSDFSSSNSEFRRSNPRKDHKNETARRRRDSLDPNLVSFEPTKTTVQRRSLQEHQRMNVRRSFLNKKISSPLNIEREVVATPADSTKPSVLMPLSKIPEFIAPAIGKSSQRQSSEKPATILTYGGNLAQPSLTAERESQILERNKIGPFSLPLGSQYPNSTHKNSLSQAYDANGEKSRPRQSLFDKTSSIDIVSQTGTKSFPESRTSLDKKPSIFSMSPSQATPLLRNPEMSNLDRKELVFPDLSSGNVNTFSASKGLLVEPAKELESHKTAASVTGSVLSEKPPQIDLRRDKRQSDDDVFPSTFSVSRSSPFSIVNPTFSPSSMTSSAPSGNSTFVAGIDRKASTTGSSGFSHPLVSASGSFAFQTTKPSVFPPSPAQQASPASDSTKTEPQLSSTVDSEITKPEPILETKSPRGIVSLKPVSSGLSGAESSSMQKADSLLSSQAMTTLPNVTPNSQLQQPSGTFSQIQNTSETVAAEKQLDIPIAQDDSMDEEAPESNCMSELNLGSLGGFGISSTTIQTTPKSNPFGGSFGNAAIPTMSSPFPMTVSSGELFRPASFNFQSPLSSQSSQSTSSIALSGGFGSGVAAQSANQGGFGLPSQIGSGLQALGSVLGTFGQSRQLGPTPQGTNSGSSSGFGGGFAGMKPMGGFSNATQGGGFGGLSSGGGGFAAVASGGGGFAAVASGSGFSGVGAGGGFQATGGGFGAFGGAPPELFTQIRK